MPARTRQEGGSFLEGRYFPLLADLDRLWPRIGRTPAESGHARPKLGQLRPTLGKVHPESADFELISAEFGGIFGAIWNEARDPRNVSRVAELVELGALSATMVLDRDGSGLRAAIGSRRLRYQRKSSSGGSLGPGPNLAKPSPNSRGARARCGRTRAEFGRHRRNSAQLGCTDFGRV